MAGFKPCITCVNISATASTIQLLAMCNCTPDNRQLEVLAGSVLMTGQKAPATEILGSRKSVRRGKVPLPAKYDVLLQLFGEF